MFAVVDVVTATMRHKRKNHETHETHEKKIGNSIDAVSDSAGGSRGARPTVGEKGGTGRRGINPVR